jgi:predicted AlkP superfamily pyrophosphatase or phosphodiesterase
MKTIWIFLFLFITLSLPFNRAQSQMVIPPEKPKLIVQIVISQMRYDYLQRYSSKFSDDGFMHLVNEGAFCRNARYNFLLTQSLPGIATVSTGAMPSVHGIVSNKWYSRISGQSVDAIADEKVTTVGGSYLNGKFSPRNLITSTLGDELRMVDPRSKVVGVSLDPASAIISSGHNANGVYWMDLERGKWISNSFYMDILPQWVDSLNAKGFADLYLNRDWNLSNPLNSYFEADTSTIKQHQAKKRIADKLRRLVSGIILAKKPTRDYSLLLETPYGNNYVKDFAIAAIVGENLGKDDHTDLITITFTPTRFIGQKYGPHSIEMEDTYLRLDREMAHFISFLNTEIGKHNYLLVLTSDQGVAATPEHLEKSKIPGGYFDPRQATTLLGSYLNISYGTGNWVLGYHEKQLFLNRRLIEDSNLNLSDVQERVANFMLQFTGVANAITAHNLQSSNFTSGIFEKFQNSFNQRRSGDVIINLEPGWVERNGNVTSANSPYSYDAHVPLIWYGWRMKRRQILNPVDMADIAPTLSTLIGISWPNGATGKPIKEIIE